MLEGAEVKEYFEKHPEAKEIIESTEAQFETWKPELSHEEMYRLLTVDDVKFISFEGWQGEKGVFAWYFPCGIPHYTKINDEEGGPYGNNSDS